MAKERLLEMTADSVSFHLSYNNRILWFKFSGAQDDWDGKQCIVHLITISVPDGIQKYKGDQLPELEKQAIRSFFEKNVVKSVDSLLHHN